MDQTAKKSKQKLFLQNIYDSQITLFEKGKLPQLRSTVIILWETNNAYNPKHSRGNGSKAGESQF